jgi:hypothetical protein
MRAGNETQQGPMGFEVALAALNVSKCGFIFSLRLVYILKPSDLENELPKSRDRSRWRLSRQTFEVIARPIHIITYYNPLIGMVLTHYCIIITH